MSIPTVVAWRGVTCSSSACPCPLGPFFFLRNEKILRYFKLFHLCNNSEKIIDLFSPEWVALRSTGVYFHMQDVGWQLLIFIVFWILSIKKNENHCHTGFKSRFRFLWMWNLRAALHLQNKWLDKQNCGWQAGNTSNDKQSQSPSQGGLVLSSSTAGWLASLGALHQLLAFNSIFSFVFAKSCLSCPDVHHQHNFPAFWQQAFLYLLL